MSGFVVIGQGIIWGVGETVEAAIADCGGCELPGSVADANYNYDDAFFVARATKELVAQVAADGGRVAFSLSGGGFRPLAWPGDPDDADEDDGVDDWAHR